jgi:DMSO/TMAO reductase YedYZ molybdopterin-dependent catalytic subunit
VFEDINAVYAGDYIKTIKINAEALTPKAGGTFRLITTGLYSVKSNMY